MRRRGLVVRRRDRGKGRTAGGDADEGWSSQGQSKLLRDLGRSGVRVDAYDQQAAHEPLRPGRRVAAGDHVDERTSAQPSLEHLHRSRRRALEHREHPRRVRHGVRERFDHPLLPTIDLQPPRERGLLHLVSRQRARKGGQGTTDAERILEGFLQSPDTSDDAVVTFDDEQVVKAIDGRFDERSVSGVIDTQLHPEVVDVDGCERGDHLGDGMVEGVEPRERGSDRVAGFELPGDVLERPVSVVDQFGTGGQQRGKAFFTQSSQLIGHRHAVRE